MGVNKYEVWIDGEKDSGFNDRIDAIDAARGLARAEGDKAIQVWDNVSKYPKHILIQWREQTGVKPVGGRHVPRYDKPKEYSPFRKWFGN